MSKVTLKNETGDPAPPPSGYLILYPKAETLFWIDSAGTVASLANEGTAILSTGPVTDGFVLTADGAGGAAWEAPAAGGAFSADAQTQITPSTPIVLDEATGDEIALDLSVTVNKASSGNYTLLKAYATETAAPGASNLLLDLGVGVTRKVSASNLGELTAVQILSQHIGAPFGTAATTIQFGSNPFGTFNSAAVLDAASNADFRLRSTAAFSWSSSASRADTAADLKIKRSAAGVLLLTDSGGTSGGSLKMDLTTEDRGFINFAGTADADATSAISTHTTSGATTGHIQVAINGTKAWIAVSTNAPTA